MRYINLRLTYLLTCSGKFMTGTMIWSLSCMSLRSLLLALLEERCPQLHHSQQQLRPLNCRSSNCSKWALTNIRSLCNKQNDFALFLAAESPDIICVTETWLHADIPDTVYCVVRDMMLSAVIEMTEAEVLPCLSVIISISYWLPSHTIYTPQRLPPYLQYAVTLPCDSWKSKNIADFYIQHDS